MCKNPRNRLSVEHADILRSIVRPIELAMKRKKILLKSHKYTNGIV